MNRATFRFYEELNDFLPPERKKQAFVYEFNGNPSIKDAIEAIGVPHIEVDLALVNGLSVDFRYQLRNGDMVSVYPVFEGIDITPIVRLREKPLRILKFILDGHLGKLARYLRICGFDTDYENNRDDPEIIRLSLSDQRVILTRDIGLLKNGAVTHGYWVRSQHAGEQLREVLVRFDLKDSLKSFTRCPLCNGLLETAEKKDMEAELLPKTLRYYEDFKRCAECGHIYWQGPHYERMKQMIGEIVRSL